MKLNKFLEVLNKSVEQTPKLLDSEITDIDILKIQHDGTETVERIELTVSDGASKYNIVSAFNYP